jgi:hypothetical protein
MIAHWALMGGSELGVAQILKRFTILLSTAACMSPPLDSEGSVSLTGAPGVYWHKDATKQNADNYCRYVQLYPAGLFYAVKWEVRVRRVELLKPPRHTDQWIQNPDGAKFATFVDTSCDS